MNYNGGEEQLLNVLFADFPTEPNDFQNWMQEVSLYDALQAASTKEKDVQEYWGSPQYVLFDIARDMYER